MWNFGPEITKRPDNNAIARQEDRLVLALYQRCLPVVLALLFVMGIFGAIELYHVYETETKTIDIAKSQLISRLHNTSSNISEHLSRIPPLVHHLAETAKAANVKPDTLRNSLDTLMRTNNELLEVGVAYATSAGMSSYSPHYGMKDGHLAYYELDYDYTQKDWFWTTLASGPGWFEPYYGPTTRTMVLGYAEPFGQTGAGAARAGVARGNLALNEIRNLLAHFDSGNDGYIFILSAKRRFIFHPISRYTSDNLDINAFDSGSGEQAFFHEIADALNKEERGTLSLTDPISKKTSWVVYSRIAETGWTLVSVNIEEDLIAGTLHHSHIHKIRALILLTAAMLLFWLYLGMRIRLNRGIHTAWATSVAFSLTLVAALAIMGFYLHESTKSNRLKTVTNMLEVEEIAARYESKKYSEKDPPVSVPTGVFVQSIEFNSSNNVLITGYVWQRTPANGKVTPGIIFPESVSGSTLSKVYSNPVGKGILTVWYFETVFRQPFDYSKYPLDNKDVSLRLWHGNFAENVILVPDLSSYNVSAAELYPGVEETIVLSGWQLKGSGFQYVKHNYNSSFGFPVTTLWDSSPELCFMVRLERNFIDAFITNLVPLIVVAIMLFAILLTITCDPEKSGLFGADAFSVVTSTAGLFFIVLVAHIQLRKDFSQPNIVFLEYFYLVMYFAILWVSVSGFLVTSARPSQLMHYRDGLFAKIFYWPMILTALMLVSYRVFL